MLTAKEKRILTGMNYSENDIQQIDAALNKTRFEYLDEHDALIKKISRHEARAILGDTDFLSGIARSAFHWTAMRATPCGDKIYFDSSRFFK